MGKRYSLSVGVTSQGLWTHSSGTPKPIAAPVEIAHMHSPHSDKQNSRVELLARTRVSRGTGPVLIYLAPVGG